MEGDAGQIRDARLRAGLTQRELAARSGVRQSNIAAYETGRRRPTPSMLSRLLQAARPRPSAVVDQHRQQVAAAAARHHATNLRVFGSIARGDDVPGSDLDLLVTFDSSASLLDQVGLIHDLESLLGVSVDVLSDRALRDRDDAIRGEAIPL